MPFVTEEVWSWWQEGSVHAQAWPAAGSIPAQDVPAEFLETVSQALSEIRRTKTEAKVSQRTEVVKATLRASQADIDTIAAAQSDLQAAGRVTELVLDVDAEAEGPRVADVEFAPTEDKK